MQSPVNLIAVLLTVSTIAMFSLLRLFNLSDPECLDKETFEYVVYELNDLDYLWASGLCIAQNSIVFRDIYLQYSVFQCVE